MQVGEDVYNTIRHAKAYLAKPDAILIPARAVLMVQLLYLQPRKGAIKLCVSG